jgi:hypothetical protein
MPECWQCGRQMRPDEVQRRDVTTGGGSYSGSGGGSYGGYSGHDSRYSERQGGSFSHYSRVTLCPSCAKIHDQNESFRVGLIVAIVVVGCLVAGFFALRDRFSFSGNNQSSKAAVSSTKAANQTVPAKAPERKLATIVLLSAGPWLRGSVVYAEIDGLRVADWPVGQSELRLDVEAGEYLITVHSTYRGLKGKWERRVTVSASETVTFTVK